VVIRNRASVDFQLPSNEPVTMPVKNIDSGTYFIGRLVSVKKASAGPATGGFDALENKGVFYRTNAGITFIENDTDQPGRGGRWWGDNQDKYFRPDDGGYVENFKLVKVRVEVSPL
jgi:hypothetical protein